MGWILERAGFTQEDTAENGNRFLVGNGYMGVRGTLDEHGAEGLAAVNLAGIYDQVGTGWREPLNAPNPLHTLLRASGAPLAAQSAGKHTQRLNFRHGIASRETLWDVPSGQIRVESSRIAHIARPHILASRYTVSADCPVEIELFVDIDCNIWEIYGPHYRNFRFSCEEDTLLCLAEVQNGRDQVAVGRRCVLSCGAERVEGEGSFTYRLTLRPGRSVVLTSVCAVYTSNDAPHLLDAVRGELAEAGTWEELLPSHRQAWEEIWERGAVEIQGDPEAQDQINYALYHLNAIAPRHRDDLSIPARGLSGQTYKGAVFWDSEMFILDYFLYTQPQVARSMVRYRIETLPGALEKARRYGWQGAFYAWESQEGGYDACSDYNVTDVFTKRPMRTYFKDKQVHISAAVARAVMLYTTVSGDTSLLVQGGARTVLECARFYYSLLLRRSTGSCWEIHDVIGPDEYHERVNNNAYTNRMAQETFRWAVQASELFKQADREAYEAFCRETGAGELLPLFSQAAEELYVPQPDETGVIPQFDGYFDLEDTSPEQIRQRLLDPKEYWGGAYGVASQTQVIKQADVAAMMEMFHRDYSREIMEKNWAYYEPRTEHGSSLSACMYALLACRFGRADLAYPFFQKSAQADWAGGGKQWAGLVYIGGTHPAAEGGAWKVLAEGFAGLDCGGGTPQVHPCLPGSWRRLKFHFCCRGQWYLAELTQEDGKAVPLEKTDGRISVYEI